MVEYNILVHECSECVKQMCDGILFFDKDAIIVIHVSKSQSIDFFKSYNSRILVNPTQFATSWGWDFTKIHVSNHLYAKTFNFDITYVLFLTSNTLMIKNPSEYIKNYDAGFSEQQHGVYKLTPPLLIEPYQIGWGGGFLNDPRYLSVLNELNSDKKYGCIIDSCYVTSDIMDKICYFHNKYFGEFLPDNENKYPCPEEIFIPTIACNLANKISDALLFMSSLNIDQFKELMLNKNNENHKTNFFNKRIPRDMKNEIRKYYNTIIYNI